MLSRLRSFVEAAVLSAALLTTAPAAAQSPGNRAIAEALFSEARTLMAEGKLEDACPKFDRSFQLDPAIGTRLNYAVCLERQGKLASAWAEFSAAVAEASNQNQRDRQDFAQRRADALLPRLAYLVVVLNESDRQRSGLTIVLSQSRVGATESGAALPVDPGRQTIYVQADGCEPWSQSVDIPTSPGKIVVEVPALEPSPPSSSPPPPRPPVALAPTTHAAPTKSTKKPTQDRLVQPSSSVSSAVGYVLVGVGVVGIGVGSYFGWDALSLKSERDDHCRDGRCDARGLSLDEDARSSATVANIAVGTGLVAAGAGVVLLLIEVETTSVGIAPTWSTAGVGLSTRGAW